mgnify:CR=1 FL=1
MKITIITLLFALASSFSYSQQVSDVNFSDALPATNGMPELTLNGASLRELYLLIETYAGALYLENTSHDAAEIIESIQYKKMVFHVLMKKVSARRLSNALEEALVLNISKEQYSQIQPAVEQMLSYFTGNILKGETVEFNYIPGKGTDVIISGALQGRIKGKEYFDSMLKVWIGEYPVTREFKNQVLGSIDL